MEISVHDLMSTRPLSISASATLREATQIVLARALDAICICDDDGRLLGCVSDYELLKARLMNVDADVPVCRFMGRSLVTLTPDMLLEDVACLFRDSCQQRLVVLENGCLVGQLHRRDVLRAIVVMEKLRQANRSVRIENIGHDDIPEPTLQMQPVLKIAGTTGDAE